jgi:hypothetical protein
MMKLCPVERSFDWFCGIGGGYKQQRPLLCTPEGGACTDGCSAELITDAAIEKIQDRGDRTWLAYMAYIIPHTLWECPDAYAQPHRDAGIQNRLPSFMDQSSRWMIKLDVCCRQSRMRYNQSARL